MTVQSTERIEEALAWLRRTKPHLYVVIKLLRRSGGERYHGFFEDAAERLGITPQAVSYRWKKGLELLAERIRQQEEARVRREDENEQV